MGILYKKVMQMRENGRSFLPKVPTSEPECKAHKNEPKHPKDDKKYHNEPKEVLENDNGANRKS